MIEVYGEPVQSPEELADEIKSELDKLEERKKYLLELLEYCQEQNNK